MTSRPEVKAKIGKTFLIYENNSAGDGGYNMQVCYDPSHLELVEMKRFSDHPLQPGETMHSSFEFMPLKPGFMNVIFVIARPWEHSILNTVTYNIFVEDDGREAPVRVEKKLRTLIIQQVPNLRFNRLEFIGQDADTLQKLIHEINASESPLDRDELNQNNQIKDDPNKFQKVKSYLESHYIPWILKRTTMIS